MKEIDFYLQYLDEGFGDTVARGIGKVQGLVGKGMMAANLLNFGNLSPTSQALTGVAAGTMGLNAYQRWKQKQAAQQQPQPQGQPQQQMKFPNR
jgi:uncharacterized membrane protein YebE (DUF533 family)